MSLFYSPSVLTLHILSPSFFPEPSCKIMPLKVHLFSLFHILYLSDPLISPPPTIIYIFAPPPKLFFKFLDSSHSPAFSVFCLFCHDGSCYCLQDTAPLFLFRKALGCKPPTLCCYSVVESSCRPRQPRSVDSLWYHGNGGLENLTL